LVDLFELKVEFTLEYAMKAQRESTGIALLFLYLQHYMGVGGQCHTPGRDLVPTVQEAKQAPGAVSLDGSGKSHPHWDLIPIPVGL
jgi:hypothetical protein